MWVINHGVLINFNYAASNFFLSLSVRCKANCTFLGRQAVQSGIHPATDADGKSCEAAAAAAVGGPRKRGGGVAPRARVTTPPYACHETSINQ